MNKEDYKNVSRAELIKEIILLNNEKENIKAQYSIDLEVKEEEYIKRGVPNALKVCEYEYSKHRNIFFFGYHLHREKYMLNKALKTVVNHLKEIELMDRQK